jgi:ADP-ribose pyrophosphatase
VPEPWREHTLEREVLYDGRIIRLERHRVQLRGERVGTREVVRHPGAVAVLAEPSPGRLLFVRQYRKAPDEVLLEIPAGKLEPDEDPRVCAERELSEETGYRAGKMEPVAAFFTSPGFADEKIHLFYARELQPGEAHPDVDEEVQVIVAERQTVEGWLSSGAIQDAKTLVGVLWWLHRQSLSVKA